MSSAKLQSLLQSGLAHHRAGRLAEAEGFYRQGRGLAPQHFELILLSGLVAYQAGRVTDAIEFLGQAVRQAPRHASAVMHHGLALLAANRPAEAERQLRRATELQPTLAEAWDNLAYFLKTQNRLADAVTCHERALSLSPDSASSWYNYGLTLSLCGREHEALGCHERAIAADPKYAKARFGRAQALQQTHRIAEAVAEYDRFLILQPQHHEARSYRLFALQYLDGLSRERMLEEHREYGRAVGLPAPSSPGRLPDPARRLRVAFLSPDLRGHSVAYFIEPLLRHLDPAQFDVWLYHDHFCEDAVSQRLKSLAAGWRNFVGQPASAVLAAIRADAPDLIVDLAGHTGLNRLPLLARRLAPVQISYLGYPNTTGVPAMDHRFTDEIADPQGDADAFATERLVRFSSVAWAYQPSGDAPPVSPLPAATNGTVTFGCFNNPAKITDATLTLWGRVLAAVPGSRLRLKGAGLGHPTVRARYAARLAHCGVAPAQVDLLERTPDATAHLALYHGIDLAFDTSPYNGTTTTCEALWMGVPVVTLTGRDHRARVGTSLLTAVGHPEWCARDADEFVRVATALALDPARLATLRRGLRSELEASPLLDHAGQAAKFGSALRGCWAAWCERAASKAA
ncbi:MAG: tetratricopeptide repeat protein [Opitutaceae bacterium]|nr:tetratricopeptide repeat protein [Opitutaceae bacterium]